MTTFDTDIIRLNTKYFGARTFRCSDLGLEWPPPERIAYDLEQHRFVAPSDDEEPAAIFRRVSMSEITDEQMEGMTHVARGAEYAYEVEA